MCVIITTNVFGGVTYSELQSASLYLYDANMCGNEVSSKSLADWRGNCHSYDGRIPLDIVHTDLSASFINSNRAYLDSDGDGYVDLSGGYHDAGDFVKFGLPQIYTAVTLQWGLYEFKDTFEKNGDMSHLGAVLKQFTDYIKKSTFRDNSGNVIAFCYQVGNGDTDHSYWGAPEVQTTARPAYFATKDTPATDIVSLAAASLAADYINYGNTDSLAYSKALYNFAYNSNKAMAGDHSNSGGAYYRSGSYQDDMAMAEAWLYMATGDNTYLERAKANISAGIYGAPYWIYCWDDTWLGAITLIAEKTNNEDYWNTVKETLDIWQKNYNTPQGYACIDRWGSARYNTNAQYLALLYSKYKGDMAYANWAKGQMDYLLGKNAGNKCYVTGISENSVKYPHHAAASGLSDAGDTSEHKNILYGALVGGPDENDYHIDSTSDYQYNEVAIDYNAGLVCASAGMNYLFGADCPTGSTALGTGF